MIDYQLLREAPALVARAIARGTYGLAFTAPAVKPTQPKQPDEARKAKDRKRALAAYYAKRDANLAAGKTSNGKPRRRQYKYLDGLTESQKRERQKAQTRTWRKKQ